MIFFFYHFSSVFRSLHLNFFPPCVIAFHLLIENPCDLFILNHKSIGVKYFSIVLEGGGLGGRPCFRVYLLIGQKLTLFVFESKLRYFL